MPPFKSASLIWLDQIAALTAQLEKTPNASYSELAKIIQKPKSLVSGLLAIKACFDPAAIEKVKKAASAEGPQPTYTLSFNSARELTGLMPKGGQAPSRGQEDNKADSTAFHAALDITLSRQLDTRHIKALVDWIAQGNSPESFQVPESGKKGRSKAKTKEDTSTAPEKGADPLEPLAKLFHEYEAAKARGDEAPEREKLMAYMATLFPGEGAPGAKEKENTKNTSNKKGKPSMFWEAMAGISVISQIKSLLKKGEEPWWVYPFLIFWQLLKALGFVLKYIVKGIGKGFHWLWHSFIESLKELGIYKKVSAVFSLLFLVLLGWFAWQILFHGWAYPFKLIAAHMPVVSGFFKHNADPETAQAPTPVQTAPPVVAAEAPAHNAKTPAKHRAQSPRPVISSTSVVAWKSSGNQKDSQRMELEFESVPTHSVIEALSIEPDAAMRVDMATSRINDMTDKTKYTLMIGKKKQIVLKIPNDFAKFTIHYQADTLNPLENGEKIWNSYWIDLVEFHVNVIESYPNGTQAAKLIYQLTIISNDQPLPLTFQCATQEDLEHLVSGLEVWAKSTRDGKPIPITGMPYLNQGLKLDHDGQVVMLWAGSPMEKTKLKLGDYVWSLKDRETRQTAAEMEAALRALAPGEYKFYIVTAKDWQQAMADKIANPNNDFIPLIRAARLTVAGPGS